MAKPAPRKWSDHFIEAGQKLYGGLCDLAHADFPRELESSRNPDIDTPFRESLQGDPKRNVQQYTLALVRSPAFYRLRHGRRPSERDLENSRRIYPSDLCKRAAPDVGWELISEELRFSAPNNDGVSSFQEWLRIRGPQVHFLTLGFASIPADSTLRLLRFYQHRLKKQVGPLKAVVTDKYGSGGCVWWDIAPTRRRIAGESVRCIHLHLHMVVEPYDSELPVDPVHANKWLSEIQLRWERRLFPDDDPSVYAIAIPRQRRDTVDVVLYTLGSYRRGESRATKLLKMFDESRHEAQGLDPEQATMLQMESTRSKPCLPDRNQLRHILAFHAFPDPTFDRRFGSWARRSKLGKKCFEDPSFLVNTPDAWRWPRRRP